MKTHKLKTLNRITNSLGSKFKGSGGCSSDQCILKDEGYPSSQGTNAECTCAEDVRLIANQLERELKSVNI